MNAAVKENPALTQIDGVLISVIVNGHFEMPLVNAILLSLCSTSDKDKIQFSNGSTGT